MVGNFFKKLKEIKYILLRNKYITFKEFFENENRKI